MTVEEEEERMTVEEVEERMTVEEEEQGKGKTDDTKEASAGEERVNGSPKRYLPLCDLYSSTSPQKVVDPKMNDHSHHQSDARNQPDCGGADIEKQRLSDARNQSDCGGADIEKQRLPQAQTGVRTYSRRSVTAKNYHGKPSDLDALKADASLEDASSTVEKEVKEEVETGVGILTRKRKRDMRDITEQIELEGDLRKLHKSGGSSVSRRRRRNDLYSGDDQNPDDSAGKRWVRLMFRNGDAIANKLVGLECQIYWPLDEEWYNARINEYNEDTHSHHIVYEDGVKEDLLLFREKVKIFISGDELQKLNLKSSIVASHDINENDLNETADVGAAKIGNELGPGDIIWAKLTGHPAWPALILRDDLISARKGLNREKGGNKSFSVQFFGSHNFARVSIKQTIPFSKGLDSGFHLKCKKPVFTRGLEEIRPYLCKQRLPKNMLLMQHNTKVEVCERSQDDEDNRYSDEHCVGVGDMKIKIENSESFLLQIGDLKVINIGKIVDSKHFQNEKFIWPEGYTAVRTLPSLKASDPNVSTRYKMEVIRDTDPRNLPLFKVTLDTGEQFKGSTPSSCWRKIYNSINDTDYSSYDRFISEGNFRPGSDMFGFSCPEVLKLIKSL